MCAPGGQDVARLEHGVGQDVCAGGYDVARLEHDVRLAQPRGSLRSAAGGQDGRPGHCRHLAALIGLA